MFQRTPKGALGNLKGASRHPKVCSWESLRVPGNSKGCSREPQRVPQRTSIGAPGEPQLVPTSVLWGTDFGPLGYRLRSFGGLKSVLQGTDDRSRSFRELTSGALTKVGLQGTNVQSRSFRGLTTKVGPSGNRRPKSVLRGTYNQSRSFMGPTTKVGPSGDR